MQFGSVDLFFLLFLGDMAAIKTETEAQKYLNSFCFDIMFLIMGF